MSDAVELVKVLVSPTEKLIDAISRGVGKLYEPHHIKKMADAKAYEISQIGTALTDYSEIPTIYDSGNILMDTSDTESFMARVNARVSYQESLKQRNLDAVISMANSMLAASDPVPNDPVDQDWTLRFINTVEYVSSEQLQTIWASVLACKMRNSSAVSLRALDLLKNMSKEEVALFQKVLPYVFVRGNECFLFGYTQILASMGITNHDILLLDECGILLSGDNGIKFTQANGFGYENCFHNNDQIIQFHMNADNPQITFRQFPLTRVGCELYRILRTESNRNFLKQATTFITSLPKAKGLELTVHKLLDTENCMSGDETVIWMESGARIPTVDHPVNINQATVAELSALPSIYASVAQNIVSYREQNGYFTSLEELRKVSGIGKKRLDNLRPYATV